MLPVFLPNDALYVSPDSMAVNSTMRDVLDCLEDMGSSPTVRVYSTASEVSSHCAYIEASSYTCTCKLVNVGV